MTYLRYLPAILWAVFILVVSIRPLPELPEVKFMETDKLMHLVVYSVLTLLFAWAAAKQYGKLKARFSIVAFIAIACFLFGFGIEIVQGTLVVNRVFDLWDAAANGMGCAIGSVIAYCYF